MDMTFGGEPDGGGSDGHDALEAEEVPEVDSPLDEES